MLRSLAARGADHPLIVAGDLNATAWSSAFAGLALKRAGTLRATWPATNFGLGIPIDHVLASAHWRVAASDVGPPVGSDHRPVIAHLQLARAARLAASPPAEPCA